MIKYRIHLTGGTTLVVEADGEFLRQFALAHRNGATVLTIASPGGKVILTVAHVSAIEPITTGQGK